LKNIRKFNKSLSIKHSILLLTLLPALLITTVLTIYLIISRQSDAQDELLIQVNSAISYLAKSSELPLFSGDIPTLERLADATISNTDMKSVIFYDSNGKALLTFGGGDDVHTLKFVNSTYRKETNTQWIFQTPVFNSEINVDDYNEESLSKTNQQKIYLGWVQIKADKTPLLNKQRTIFLAGISVGSLIFGLLALIGLKFSRSITLPLDKLIETVRELESGDFNSRVSVSSTGEIKELVDGVNQLADKVKISNEGLKVKVNQATKQLTSALSELEIRNIELEVTGKKLINASNVQDEFLASVSHELRTPLTSIIGYTELLRKTPLEANQEEQVDTIYQASKILLHLIENILDFSKLESDSLELEFIPFNLRQLLNEVLSLHLPAAEVKNLKLRLTADIKLPEELVGDSLRLKQILNNLIHNAIKFTNQGFVDISISPLDDEFGLLCTIKDTGMGMILESQSQLFQPFNQLDTSITRRFGGTGLGLVICKKLVSQFGGTIDITSEIGTGTEVTFSIRNIYPKESIENSKGLSIKKDQTTFGKTALDGKLIVLAEDNSFVQKLLVGVFQNEGATVIAVDDGLLVIDEIQKQKPDVVVLDYQMPMLDGIKTCKKIRQFFSSEDLPVILLTADVININKVKVKDVGVNEIIYKPINSDELVDCIKELTFCRKINKPTKVLDIVSEDLLKEEISRLVKDIFKANESKNYINLKKYIHELCGISGSSSNYRKAWEIARKMDLKMDQGEYDCIKTDLEALNNILMIS